MRRAPQRGAIERAAHRIRSKREAGRRRKVEAVAAAAEPGLFEIPAIPVGERLPDQPAAGQDVETHWRFRVIGVLRPAGNALGADDIEAAAKLAKACAVIARPQPGAPIDAAPDRLHFVAIIKARRAIACGAQRRGARRVRIDRVVLVRIVEHATAVVVDEGFRRRRCR